MISGGPGKIETDQLIDGHRQTAAIEAGFSGGAPPEVRRAEKTPRRTDQFLPEVGIPERLPVRCRIFFRSDDIERFDQPRIPELLRTGMSLFLRGEIAEADLVEPLAGDKIGGIKPLLLQAAGQAGGVFRAGKGAGLDCVAQLQQFLLLPHLCRRRQGRRDGTNGRTAAAPDQNHKDQDPAEKKRCLALLHAHDGILS